MGFLQRAIASKQLFGDIPTYCRKCKEKQTISGFNYDGSYTRKCGCGCEVLKFHEPDAFHATAYFIRVFIPKNHFNKDFKNMDNFEKLGFKKIGVGKYAK